MFMIKLDKFELSEITPGTHINIVGKRGSGKTYLAQNIIHYLTISYNYDCIVVSPSSKKKNEYSDALIYYSIDELLESNKKINSNTVLVFDDCFGLTAKLSAGRLLQLISNKYICNVIFVAQSI